MKPTESLPLKEWYLQAEEYASIANRMIQLGKEIENIPENAPADAIEYLKYYMNYVVNYEGTHNTLDEVQEALQAARGEE